MQPEEFGVPPLAKGNNVAEVITEGTENNGVATAPPAEVVANAAAPTLEQVTAELRRLSKESPEQYEALSDELGLKVPLSRITDVNAKRDQYKNQADQFKSEAAKTQAQLEEFMPKYQQIESQLNDVQNFIVYLNRTDSGLASEISRLVREYQAENGGQQQQQQQQQEFRKLQDEPEFQRVAAFVNEKTMAEAQAAYSSQYKTAFDRLVSENSLPGQLVADVDDKMRVLMGNDILNNKDAATVMDDIDLYFHQASKGTRATADAYAQEMISRKNKEYVAAKKTDSVPGASAAAPSVSTAPRILKTEAERSRAFNEALRNSRQAE